MYCFTVWTTYWQFSALWSRSNLNLRVSESRSLVDFQVLAAPAKAGPYIDDEIAADSIFYKKATRVAYEKFLRTALDEEQMTSLIWIAHAGVWMACVIEDLQLRLKVIGRGARYPHVLKSDTTSYSP